MAAKAELLPLVREWGARPARLSDDRPFLTLACYPDSDCYAALSRQAFAEGTHSLPVSLCGN